MPVLHLDDAELYYEVDGTGPPLLMLAGMLSDSASWLPVVPLLAKHFTLIRPDNRLTGRTLPELSPADPVIYAADALALLDHLDLPQAHVLGHSMGALIGLEMAYAAPERITDLTLAGITVTANPRLISWFDTVLQMRKQAPEGLWLRALLIWLMRSEFYRDPANLDAAVAAGLAYPHAQSTEAMAAQIAALRAYRPTGNPSSLNVRAHAILSEQDMFIDYASARESLSALRGITITTLKDAGHSMHWDQPQTFADAVTRFIQNHP